MSIHGARMRERIVSPNGIQNYVASESAVGILQEVSQKIVFGARQFHHFAALQNNAPREIHSYVAELHNSVLVLRRATQQGMNSSQDRKSTRLNSSHT